MISASSVLAIASFVIDKQDREFMVKHIAQPVVRVVSRPFRRKKKTKDVRKP